MNQLGKYLLMAGAGILVMGAIIWVLGKLGFRGLPGDVRIESGNTRIYFPIVTCLVICVVLSLVMSVVRWLTKS